MTDIDKRIQNARPSLKKVAPLTFWISVGFAWTNIAIWALLSRTNDALVKQIPVPTVVGPLDFDIWGGWFLFLALFMVYALIRNDWKKTRLVLIMGFVSKLLWTYSLVFMIIGGYNVYATTILWAFLAWTQGWTIIHFMPLVGTNDREDMKR